MALIFPANQSKITISRILNGRLIYKTVASNSVVANIAGDWMLSNIDMTRNTNCSTFSFSRLFEQRVDELGFGSFSSGFSGGFTI